MAKRKDIYIPDLNEKSRSKYVVRVLVVAVIVALGIFLYRNIRPDEETDTERGVARLEELEQIDVAETEKTIRGLREQYTEDQITENEDLTENLKGEYLDASILIAGDSLAQSLIDYDVLDTSNVVAAIGSGVDQCSSDINTVIAYEPENVVLSYGLDDLVYFAGDSEAFIDGYETIISQIKAEIKGVNIYVCSIPTPSAEAIEDQSVYGSADEFNSALKKMSRLAGVEFVELDGLVNDYISDGIHPSYEFYTAWAETLLDLIADTDQE